MAKKPNRVTLTVVEVAELLGISKVSAYRLIADGKLPHIQVSPGRVVIPRVAFDKWLSNCGVIEDTKHVVA